MEDFIKQSTIFNLEESIIIKGIEIRRQYRTKLPDAIIAATAHDLNFTLLTRNTSDFKNISGLDLLNPWDL
ncbi:MAG: PIN domain-containing protein [Ginsengibacter sp.]